MPEFPTDVPGLFTSETQLDFTVTEWKSLLLHSDSPTRCALERLTFCKARRRKQHEFIVLYFRHWLLAATAVLVVDRAVKPSSKRNGYFTPITHSLGVTSPSALQTPAADSVFRLITLNKDTGNSGIEKYLRERHGSYKELCNLTFSAMSVRPSATQISVLLAVISQHAPNYNVYQFQCYWFARTIWEATKQLCPDSEYTEAPWTGKRSRWYGIKVDTANSVDAVRKKYANEWKGLEEEAKQKKQAEDTRMREMYENGLAQGRAEGLAQRDRLLAENAKLRSAKSPKVMFEFL